MICVTRRAELCILYSRLRASVREVWRDGREMTRAHQSGHTHEQCVAGLHQHRSYTVGCTNKNVQNL